MMASAPRERLGSAESAPGWRSQQRQRRTGQRPPMWVAVLQRPCHWTHRLSHRAPTWSMSRTPAP